MVGYIKLFKKIIDWEWYTDSNTLRVFLHLLLKANFKRNRWKGIEILPGQVVAGRKMLAKDLNLSEQEIRTAIAKLKLTSEVTTKTTKRISIITICNWESYQGLIEHDQPTNQPQMQPKINQQATTLEERKELKKKESTTKLRFSPPSLEDVIQYFSEKGYSQETALKAFEYYSSANWRDSTGKSVINWKQKMIAVWFKPENKVNSNPKIKQPELIDWP